MPATVHTVNLFNLTPDDIKTNSQGDSKWVDLGPVTIFFDSWSDFGKVVNKLQYLFLCNASDDDLATETIPV